MRPPAEIALWLSTEDMQTWVREAPDKASYQRRLAIWLTHVERLSAHRVAQSLCVSTPAVWRWVQQYNHQGPEGLHRAGRGGRRWSFLNWEQEQRFLGKRLQAAARGEVLTAKLLHGQLQKITGREVSLGYVYRLLRRHGWRKLGPRPRHPKAQPRTQEEFKKNSRNSSKQR
jgi:transposase